MIVVDSSVWIDFLNGRNAPHVRQLHTVLVTDEIIVGDLMLCEVLQGLDSERAAQDVEALLRRFEIVPMAGETIAVAAARNFRSLRRRRSPIIAGKAAMSAATLDWAGAGAAFPTPSVTR